MPSPNKNVVAKAIKKLGEVATPLPLFLSPLLDRFNHSMPIISVKKVGIKKSYVQWLMQIYPTGWVAIVHFMQCLD